MYKKVLTNQNPVERELNTINFWKENNVIEDCDKRRLDTGRAYTFYDGPPTANGKPHIGHVLTRVIKDLFPRYQSMKGNYVTRKAGWDTHGLPVEIEVEKKLGINGKEQIENYGIAPFIKECKESVWKYKGMWEDFSYKVGYWADMEHPYVTYENDFIESEWWSLKKIFDEKLLYKGFKVVPYCPRCGTPLSSHEVAQGYKDIKERSAIAKFKIKDDDTYILAWTTTPWTLPSNVALVVNANVTYAKVDCIDGNKYILAEALLDKVLSPLSKDKTKAYTVIETFPGSKLQGTEYLPLYECTEKVAKKQTDKKSFIVVCDDYVTTEDGTGVVHTAPAFGEDDARVSRKYDIAFVQFVDSKGNMTSETPFAGLFVKDADPVIIDDLKSRGLLFSAPKFEHSYPHCWRCGTPLIYYARESWFIKMTAVKDKLIKNNETINWIPESIGKGRFGDWLENVQDWGISRNRYWGTPLNIWECECGYKHAIGSTEELKSMSDNCPENIELHRPFIDEVKIKCPKCGCKMSRVTEVIDCWYDSGAMPFAQWHYPFENKETFEKNFPADFISEALDQTRGWFYSLLAISTLIFDKAPYKNVIVLGLVQDENGQKMSKSKGNAVDPFEALATHGADAIRWYFYSNSAPWLPNKFSASAVSECQRKFLGTLWNTYAFFVLYANIDKFNPNDYKFDYDSLSVMDKWLVSKTNSLVKNLDKSYSEYNVPESAKLLETFTDELSNWYVRRSRSRYWVQGMPQDKVNAYLVLYNALVTLVKVAAPMIPFMSEEIYGNLVCSVDKNAPISVHFCDFPSYDESLINESMENEMEDVLKVVVLGRAARNNAQIKNRQPLAKAYIKSTVELDKQFVYIIEDELNVKEVVLTDDVSDFANYTFKPQLRTVGPKYGKFLGKIQKYLTELNGNAAMEELNNTGFLTFDIDGNEIKLSNDDLIINANQKEGFSSQSEMGVTVVLDINLTEELIEEGFIREFLSKVQNMRKDSGFEVMDHIDVYLSDNEKIVSIISKNFNTIKNQILAENLYVNTSCDNSKPVELNEESVTLGVVKL